MLEVESGLAFVKIAVFQDLQVVFHGDVFSLISLITYPYNVLDLILSLNPSYASLKHAQG